MNFYFLTCRSLHLCYCNLWPIVLSPKQDPLHARSSWSPPSWTIFAYCQALPPSQRRPRRESLCRLQMVNLSLFCRSSIWESYRLLFPRSFCCLSWEVAVQVISWHPARVSEETCTCLRPAMRFRSHLRYSFWFFLILYSIARLVDPCTTWTRRFLDVLGVFGSISRRSCRWLWWTWYYCIPGSPISFPFDFLTRKFDPWRGMSRMSHSSRVYYHLHVTFGHSLQFLPWL